MVEMKHKVLGTVGAPKEQEKKPELPAMTDIDLKSLIELGCVRDSVQIGNLSFTMRSLNAAEKLLLADLTAPDKTDAELFAFNAKMLAISIESVNGKPFESLHPSYAPKMSESEKTDIKVDLISAMQTPAIAMLLEFYQTISDRCEAQFTVEQVKN